jgi:predicted nuclease with TOPRIM domain
MQRLEAERAALKGDLNRLRQEKVTLQKKKDEIETELQDKLRCLSFLLVKVRTNVLEKMSKHIHAKIVA